MEFREKLLRFMVFFSLISIFAIAAVGLYLGSIMPPAGASGGLSAESFGILLGAFSVANLFLAYRMFLPRMDQAQSRESMIGNGKVSISLASSPVIFGLLHYMYSGLIHYFAAFIALSLLGWLYTYRRIESRLSTLQS